MRPLIFSLWDYGNLTRKHVLEELGLSETTTIKSFSAWMKGTPREGGKILNMHYVAVMKYHQAISR